MIETRDFTCIVCPKGCYLHVKIDTSLQPNQIEVSGHSCAKGEVYGKQEVVSPMRTLTTTVKTDSPLRPRLPVKISSEIALSNIKTAMNAINSILVTPPLKRGDIIQKNLAGLGIALVAADDFINLEDENDQ